MKYLLVKVFRGTRPGEAKFSRPAIFDAQEVHLASTGACAMDNGISRGLEVMEEIYLVADALADKYVAADPTRFAVLTEAEADAWLAAAAQIQGAPIGQVRITSPDRVAHVAAKLKAIELHAAGVIQFEPPALTQEDVDVLDPTKDEPGASIVRAPTTKDVFLAKSVDGRNASEVAAKTEIAEPAAEPAAVAEPAR